jgi:hypothetical protein
MAARQRASSCSGAGNSVALGIIAPSDIWASTGHYGVKYLII